MNIIRTLSNVEVSVKSRKRWVHVSEKYTFNKSKMVYKYVKIPQDVVESVLTKGEQ